MTISLSNTCSNNNIYMLLLTPAGASREEHDAHLSHHQPRSVLTVRTLDDEAALLQASTLFILGPGHTLEAVNDISRPAAPRCFISVTPTHLRYWTTAQPAAEIVRALEAWRSQHRPPLDLDTFTEPPADVLAAVTKVHGIRPHVYCGPAYRFPADSQAPPLEHADIRLCSPADEGRFRASFPGIAATLTAREPVVAAFEKGRAVAICFASRITPQACEAGVETLPDHRGRGLATAVTARWAEHVRASGRTPLYSTSWDNTSSQAVAGRLGLIRYAATMSIYVPDRATHT